MVVCSQSNILHWQKQKHQIHWIKYFIIWVSKLNVCIEWLIFNTSISNYVKKTSFEIFQTKQLHWKSSNTYCQTRIYIQWKGCKWLFDVIPISWDSWFRSGFTRRQFGRSLILNGCKNQISDNSLSFARLASRSNRLSPPPHSFCINIIFFLQNIHPFDILLSMSVIYYSKNSLLWIYNK